MREILPGLYHWTARHERIGREVSSWYLEPERVVIDPMAPDAGSAWFDDHPAPEAVLLTNRHHYRHSAEYVQRFGATVHCQRLGLPEFTHGEEVEPFDFGDELPGGAIAYEVGAICPEETALHLPRLRALAFADGLTRLDENGPVGFVPDALLGDDPGAVKRGLVAAFDHLLELDFDHLLMAHGGPVVGGGKEVLREVVRREQ